MAEIEYAGVKVGGSKALLILPLLGTIVGVLWGGFEIYQRYLDMEAKIASYTAPDLTGIEQELAVIEETLIGLSDSVEIAKDYTRSIKNDLKDDLARQESLMERLEDKGIYLDKDIPDNQRGLRNGLANEILHNKLMDLQWQK